MEKMSILDSFLPEIDHEGRIYIWNHMQKNKNKNHWTGLSSWKKIGSMGVKSMGRISLHISLLYFSVF